MQKHNNYNNKEEPLMPTKKPRERDEDGKFVSEKAVVSELGVNDTPEPTEPKVVKTKNGNTMTFN